MCTIKVIIIYSLMSWLLLSLGFTGARIRLTERAHRKLNFIIRGKALTLKE